MGLRPARTHRTPKRPWTRTARRKVKKAYVRGVPDPRVRAWQMGKAKPEECEIQLDLMVTEEVQIRDNAIESARVMANKIFDNKIGRENYFFKIRAYPHQVLREHSMLSGAGADRLSSGMRLAFGRPVGRAVRAKKNQVIMTVWTMKQYENYAMEGMRRAAMKITGSPKIVKMELKTAVAS